MGLLFAVLFAYTMTGFFPITAVEGDGLGIANGAAQIASIGREATSLAYRYNVQSGTYALTVFLFKLTGIETFTLLAILSALASILFILVSAALLSRITTYSFAACGLVLLLFQEIFTSGYYANSTVLAAAFFVTAFWVATFGNDPFSVADFFRLIASGFLLGLGAWMRFDMLLVTPALLLLVYQGEWKRTVTRTAVVALMTGVTVLSALYLSGSGIRQVLASAGSHRNSLSSTASGATETSNFLLMLLGSADLRSHAAFYTAVLLALIIIGIIRIIRKQDWQTLGIVLLGSLPFYIVYLGVITTPKYLYYLIPFAALLVLSSFSELTLLSTKKWNLLTKSSLLILLMLFAGQYLIGWQFLSSARPYLRESFPNFLTLFSIGTPVSGIEKVTLVIGAGSSASTADGRRLLSGILFSPLFQMYEKSRIRDEVEIFNHYLDTRAVGPLQLLTTQYSSQQLLLNLLLKRGYDCRRQENTTEQDFREFNCVKNGHTAHLMTGETAGLRAGEANRLINQMIAALQTSEIVLVTTDPQDRDVVLKQAKDSTKINDFSYELDLIVP